MKRMKKGKGQIKGPVGGPAGVAKMISGGSAQAAIPRPTRVTRLSTKGAKGKKY